MNEDKHKLTVLLPRDVYLELKTKALLRKTSVTDLIVEMVRYWKAPKMTKEDRENQKLMKKYFDKVLKPQFEEMADQERNHREGVYEKIKTMSVQGMSHAKIAAELEKQDVPTLSGRGRWHRQTVQQVLKKGI